MNPTLRALVALEVRLVLREPVGIIAQVAMGLVGFAALYLWSAWPHKPDPMSFEKDLDAEELAHEVEKEESDREEYTLQAPTEVWELLPPNTWMVPSKASDPAILTAISSKDAAAWDADSDTGTHSEERVLDRLPSGPAEESPDTGEPDPDEDPLNAWVVAYDGNDPLQRRAALRLNKEIHREFERRRDAAWHAAGAPMLPDELVDLLKAPDSPEAKARQRLSGALGTNLAFILAGSLVGIATATFATQREQGTLESLLVTRVSRAQVGATKVIVGSLLSLLTQAPGLALFMVLVMWAPKRLGAIPLTQEPWEVLPTLLLAPAALIMILQISALVHLVLAKAQSTRQAGALSLPLLAGISLLSALPSIPEVRTHLVISLLPIAGPAALLRNLGLDEASIPEVGLTILFSLGYTAIGLRLLHTALAGPVFTEGGGEARAKGVYWREAAWFFVFIMSLFWFVGQSMQAYDTLYGTPLSLAFCFGVPALLIAPMLGQPTQPLLRLRAPRPSDLGLALLMGLCAPAVGTLGGLLQGLLLPERTQSTDALTEALFSENSLGIRIVVFALAPAIFEELAFRGALLGLLRRNLSKHVQIAITAFAFGMAHLSLVRLLPTGMLGIVLGLVTLRSRSLFPAMLIHFANNALALVFMEFGSEAALPQGADWAFALGGTSVCLFLVSRLQGAIGADADVPPAR